MGRNTEKKWNGLIMFCLMCQAVRFNMFIAIMYYHNYDTGARGPPEIILCALSFSSDFDTVT